MSEVNIPLLRKVVEWAEAEHAKGKNHAGFPLGEWYQGHWVTWSASPCGTSYCIAGYVGILEDDRLAELAKEGRWSYTHEDGEYVSSWTVAQKALGLTQFQAADLFKATNTITQVRAIAERIAGEAL